MRLNITYFFLLFYLIANSTICTEFNIKFKLIIYAHFSEAQTELKLFED